MPIELKITGESPKEVMINFRGLFVEMTQMGNQTAAAAAAIQKAVEKPAGPSAAASAKVDDVKEDGPRPGKGKAKAAEKAEEPEHPTLAEAQTKLKELGAATDFETAKALLEQFKVAKAQDIPPEKRQAWINACDAKIDEVKKAKELE